MSYKRVLTIQDISCFGQCSLTVALPIISACGHETVILPSAVLSTHTSGFSGFTFRDLTQDIPDIFNHWNKEGIEFDAIYTGYLGSIQQIEMLKNYFSSLKNKPTIIVDPAMGDNGKLYPLFNDEYVTEMAKLCEMADILVPNITEASYLTGCDYKEKYDMNYVKELAEKLCNKPDKKIVITGISLDDETTGVVVYMNGEINYYKHKKYQVGCHGTGDVFASAFVGSLLNNNDIFKSATIAAKFTLDSMEQTFGDDKHKYGVKFEKSIPKLINMQKNNPEI